MLTKPQHIAVARIADPSIRYRWDEWHVQRAYQPVDPALWARLQGLTHRAIVGLTIASGEWVAYRFESLTDRPEPLEVLEAGWAANVDRAYSYPFQTEDDEWRGPILGPLNIMMAIVVDALYQRNPRTDPAESACWMSRLAQHVLPDATQFRQWQGLCVARLHRFCRAPEEAQAALFDDDAFEGDWVPRELFDPSFEYSPPLARELISRFLAPLENDDNPFLGTPEEMLDAGFEGVPYRLTRRDGEHDRRRDGV